MPKIILTLAACIPIELLLIVTIMLVSDNLLTDSPVWLDDILNKAGDVLVIVALGSFILSACAATFVAIQAIWS